MKKLLILALGFWLWWPVVVFAQDGEVCGGGEIPIMFPAQIAGALGGYTNPIYRILDGNQICLNFRILREDARIINTSLSLNNTSGLPVVISGLNVRGSQALGTQTLLSVSGANPVIIRNSSFSDCVNCLSIQGNSFRVENVTVECGGSDQGGAGILLLGSDHYVLGPGTEITNCGTGVAIGDDETAGNNVQILESQIHHNGTAIHLRNGQGNNFSRNAIYENDTPPQDALFRGLEGIRLEPVSNGGLGLPVFVNDESTGILSYGEGVEELPEDGSEVSALLQIRSPYSRGNLEIDFIKNGGEQPLVADRYTFRQGKEFYALGEFLSAVQQESGDYILTYRIPMSNSTSERFAVAVFHHHQFGSSSYSDVFKLNRPGVLSAAELEAPGITESGPAQETIFSAPENTGHTSDDHISDEDSKEEGSEMSANPIGGGSASGAAGGSTVVAGGLGGSGAPGGVGGCGGSINPAKPAFPGLLLVLLLSLAIRWSSKKIL